MPAKALRNWFASGLVVNAVIPRRLLSKCVALSCDITFTKRRGVLLTRSKRGCMPKAWGAQLIQRIGRSKAEVAVARKLAIIMHRMWISGESFSAGTAQEAMG